VTSNLTDVAPSSNATASISLKLDNDVGQLEVTFFFKVSQDSSAEKHFALTNAVQVGIEFQRFNLQNMPHNNSVYHSGTNSVLEIYSLTTNAIVKPININHTL